MDAHRQARRSSDLVSEAVLENAGFSTRAAIWLIATLFALFVAVVVLSIFQSRQDAERRAGDRAFAASQVVETNSRWIYELSRQALRRIDSSLGADIENSRSSTVAEVDDALANLPGIAKAYVVAADGRTLYSTDKGVKPIDIRDREYFSALANGAPWYVSSLLVSRLNGEQIFVFSKRLERSGKFAGAAIISFDVKLFEAIWSSSELDANSTVSLIRDDGMLVARYPFAEGPTDISESPLFTEHLKKEDRGVYRAVSVADGVERFVGYRRIEGTNLLAVASVSTTAAYAAFWRTTATTLLVALPASLALGGAALWIARLLRQASRRQLELARAIETNRLLFKDIHHRVKNNLQSVQSLVRMQAIPGEVKEDLQRRIAAMTAVHEHIYRLDQYVEVDAASLIPAIVEPLVQTYANDVKVSFDIDPIEVERDNATPLALLVNELVTNALKYAFPDGRTGNISLSFKRLEQSRAKLSIRDDGIGFDPDAGTSGMGSRLIKAMVMQMDGTHTYGVDNGSVFEAELAVRTPHHASGNPLPSEIRAAAE